MSRILVAEDEERIAAFVEKGLRAAGYDVAVVGDGGSAIEAITAGGIDLVLLDIGLPEIDGLEVLRRTREAGSEVPVIILTARDSGVDTVAGFATGANDYMSKPFRVDELLARIGARIRDAGAGAAPPAVLSAGGLDLDLRTRRVRAGGGWADLSAREFALAEAFLRHPGEVLSREWLQANVWGYDFDPGTNVVDVYVRYLRNKVGPGHVETVRGAGYRLAAALPPS